MPITFNDRWHNVKAVAYYQASSGTYTALGTNDVKNCDIFPDSGVSVGDAFVIGIDPSYSGKSNEIKLNIDIGVSATTWDGVWEYATGGSTYNPGWQPLPNVNDGTNKLQNTGQVSLSFDVPDDWYNFYIITSMTGLFYTFMIRFRVTSVSGLTEGGHVANISNNFQAKGCTIYVSGYGESSPCTFSDIYNASVSGSWNVVTKNGRSYYFDCNLSLDSGCYLESKQELIQFNRNWFIINNASSTFNIGEIYAGDKVRYGSALLFIGKNANYPAQPVVIFGQNSKVYNTHIRHFVETSFGFNGYWGAGLGSFSGASVIDCHVEGLRQLILANTFSGVQGLRAICHIEGAGSIIAGCVFYASMYAWRLQSITPPEYLHRCDFSMVTVAPLNPYFINRSNYTHYCVDCDFGVRTPDKWAYWLSGSGYNNRIHIASSLQIKVTDRDGNPIEGATAVLKDKNGNTVWTYTTNVDGYVGVEAATVTAATSTSISDNSKSWTQNQWRFREVLITSGNGAGQRRFVPAQASSPYYTLPIFPAFDVTPAVGDRFVIVPYVTMVTLRPEIEGTTNNVWSLYDTFYPFTLTISKPGYQDYVVKIGNERLINLIVALSPPGGGGGVFLRIR